MSRETFYPTTPLSRSRGKLTDLVRSIVRPLPERKSPCYRLLTAITIGFLGLTSLTACVEGSGELQTAEKICKERGGFATCEVGLDVGKSQTSVLREEFNVTTSEDVAEEVCLIEGNITKDKTGKNPGYVLFNPSRGPYWPAWIDLNDPRVKCTIIGKTLTVESTTPATSPPGLTERNPDPPVDNLAAQVDVPSKNAEKQPIVGNIYELCQKLPPGNQNVGVRINEPPSVFLAAEIRFGIVRIDVSAADLDAAKRIYDYYKSSLIATSSACDRKILFTLNVSHPPADEAGFAGFVQEYADFSERVVKERRGQIQFFEVQNEQDLQFFWNTPDPYNRYAKLYAEVYHRIKKIAPEITVASAGLSGSAGKEEYQRLKKAMEENGISPEAVCIHNYDPQTFRSLIRAVREIFPGTPLIASEVGWGPSSNQFEQLKLFIDICREEGVSLVLIHQLEPSAEGYGLSDDTKAQLKEKLLTGSSP